MADNLTLILFFPLLGGLILTLLPAAKPILLKFWANLVLGLNALWTISLLGSFDSGKDLQFVQRLPWIPSIGAEFFLGVDGYSILLVAMTAGVGFLASLASWNAIESRLKEFYATLLILQTCVTGVFLSMDAMLFFVFFEASLIPMFFLISIWGGEDRRRAAMKFLIYTISGSMLLLLGLILLHFEHTRQTGFATFSIPALWATQPAGDLAHWIFWLMFLGFAVKVPMAPFHTWLPDAHTEAPTAGSVYLASVMLKMGTYGFLRLVLPGVPEAVKSSNVLWWMSILALVAIVYGALVCLKQRDWKRLVAYSSVSHMGFCMLGIFAMNPAGISGSMLQQINHGISTGLLFLLVGLMYERRHTREISEYGGLFGPMPAFSLVFLLAVVSSMGLPPLNGFIGEVRILSGAFEMSVYWALWGGLGVVLTVAYLLWCYQRVSLGVTSEKNLRLPDLSLREWAVVLPLLLAAIGIGIHPQPVFQMLDRPVKHIMEKVRPGYYAQSN
ncbi:complex I subunit 4 family protein [Bryobacter aggregatus]|uniref:complex I subunit 4 family protein n=1 Tax=Bryobacter aggregatus TaxID=360054 RepID=UPI000565712B|nr:NADH-quinone oxidoreductase subunit M [Bryobacter aggregatus]